MKLKKLLLICCAAIAAFSISANVARQSSVDVSAAERKVKSIYDGGTYTIDKKFADYTIENGTDVSVWQGNINWNGLKKEGTQFAFIRLGYRASAASGGIYIDDKFATNIKNATAAGIPVGVYFYSQAITEAEAKAEAEYCIKKLKNYKIDLPIVMDFEYSWVDGGLGGRLYDAHLSKDKTTKVINSFLDTCTKAGYEGMLYANMSTLTDCMNASQIASKHQIWLAHYTSKTTYAGTYQYWQYSSTGSSKYVDSDDLDCDFRFVPNKVTSLTLDKTKVELTVGKNTSYKIAEAPAYNYDTITVTSSDPSVAYAYEGKIYALNHGTATITAKSNGGKTATCTVTVKEPLSNYKATVSSGSVYSGSELKPQVSVTKEDIVSGTVKASGKIYTQPSSKSTAAASVSKGNKLQISAAITVSSVKYYYVKNSAGKKGFIPASNVTATKGTVKLDTSKDVKVAYSNNINAGTAKVSITPATGTLTGSLSKNFTIAPCPVESWTASQILPQQYTGQPLTPIVKLFFGSQRLAKGKDYTLEYSDNTEVGTAKVTITAMGNFSGSMELEFEIVSEGGQTETLQEIGQVTVNGLEGIKNTGYTDIGIIFTAEDGTQYEAMIEADGMITIEALPVGKYTADVSLKNCAPKTYEIEVTDTEPIQFDTQLNLYGDVTGDGNIDLFDILRINGHVKKLSILSDYDFLIADVNFDGEINLFDCLAVNAHIKKMKLLW